MFLFDKKRFESALLKNGIIKKGDKQVIAEAYEVLRSQVANLAKFRHPNVLTIIEPLEEHKANFLFVTEPLSGCLHQASDIDDVIIQKGLLQVIKALEFVHTQANMIHLGVAPQSVFINDNSDWKLGGLGYIQPVEVSEYFIPQYDPRMPGFINIDLNYTAPEVVLENSISPESDMFSLGALIYSLYNQGATLLNCNNSTTYYREEYAKFERMLTQNNPRQLFKKVPESLFNVLPQLISRYPNQRISTQEFIQCQYFDNPLVKVMVFLDEFPTKNDDEKLIFLKSLVNLLPLFPQQLLQRKVLPIMIDLVKTRTLSLVQATLTIIILIGENMSQLSFHDRVYTLLQDDKLLQLQEAQIVILDQLHVLKMKIKSEEFRKVLLKLTDKTLDLQNSFPVQSKQLERMDIVLQVVDFPSIKNNIFPKICTIFSKTTSLTVKIKTIDSFVLLIEKKGIDKFIVQETLLPLLKSMKTRELKIMSSVLKVYTAASAILDPDQIVEQVIPQLWLLSMANTLNSAEYDSYTTALNDISTNIQRAHREKLRSLEGSKPNEEDDDQEKFRHLLYGNDEPQPHLQSPVNSTTLEPMNRAKPVMQPKHQVVSTQPLQPQPKTKPMVLKPTVKSPLGFGSQSATMQPAVKTLRQTNNFNKEDEFEDFVSAPQSVSPETPSLDWGIGSALNQPQYQSTQTQLFQASSQKLPPGFGDSILPMKKGRT